MALATKCPHCNTIFRVAADQLKLRGGIVRCGSCNEVFDGNAALLGQSSLHAPLAAAPSVSPVPLARSEAAASVTDDDAYALDFDASFDPYGLLPEYAQLKPAPAGAPEQELTLAENWESELESELQARSACLLAEAWASDAQPDAVPAAPPAEPAFEAAFEPPSEAQPEPSANVDTEAQVEAAPGGPAATLPQDEDEDWCDDDDAGQAVGYNFLHDGRREPSFDAPYDEPQELFVASAMADDDAAEAPAAVAAANDTADLADGDAADDATADVDEPGFVKQGRRRERAGKMLHLLMAAGSLALLLALLAQGVTTFRNQLAAQLPQFKPALASACAVLGCRIELPAQIELLSVEPGELQSLAEHTFSYTTMLRNQDNNAQAWPHLELTLDDANDKPLVRRVIAPRDYLPAAVELSAGFPARSEQTVKLYFELVQLKAAGYHIVIFYP